MEFERRSLLWERLLRSALDPNMSEGRTVGIIVKLPKDLTIGCGDGDLDEAEAESASDACALCISERPVAALINTFGPGPVIGDIGSCWPLGRLDAAMGSTVGRESHRRCLA